MATTDRHYDVLLAARMRPLLERRDWAGLTAWLGTLSNAQFRTAGYMLGERLTGDLPESDFWQLFLALRNYSAKAFLVTLLHQVVRRVGEGTLSLLGSDAVAVWKMLRESEIDRQKTLLALLPLMQQTEEAERLLAALGVEEGEARLPYLLRTACPSGNSPQQRASSRVSAWLLLRALKYVEHDRALLVRTVYLLMKRGDQSAQGKDFSFNLASLLRTYFGLDEVRGTFSLRIEPYQLARLDASFEAFTATLESM